MYVFQYLNNLFFQLLYENHVSEITDIFILPNYRYLNNITCLSTVQWKYSNMYILIYIVWK